MECCPAFSLRVSDANDVFQMRMTRRPNAPLSNQQIFRLQSVVITPFAHCSLMVSFKLKKSWSHPKTFLGT